MVKYYGRARTRTGSVNTNQPGLKMAGCPSSVGRKGVIDRYIGNRVNCNLKVCGYRRGAAPGARQYRCIQGVNYTLNTAGNWAIANKCVLVDPTIANTICENPAPRTRQQAGGVGRKIPQNPRLVCACSKKAFRRTWLLTRVPNPAYNTGSLRPHGGPMSGFGQLNTPIS